MKFSRKQPITTIEDFFRINFDDNNLWEYKADEVDLLAELVDLYRPGNPKKDTVSIADLLALFREQPQYAEKFALYLVMVLRNKKFSNILTDAGILADSDFFHEVKKRLFAKLIPDQPPKDTLGYVLNQVFFSKSDPLWISTIPTDELNELFDRLKFNTIYVAGHSESPLAELLFAMEVIIHRISGRALESDVIKMVPEYESLDSPFLAFQKEFALLSERLQEAQDNYALPTDLDYKQVIVLHHQCEDYVSKAFRNSDKYGISLRVNQNLLRIRQQLERLATLLPLLVLDKPEDAKENTIKLGCSLVTYNCVKNNVRKLIGESTQLLSYEVTQHTANTGEHYITRDRKEYFRMFWRACGGGLIVGILCIIKIMLGKMHTSEFGHAFLYSMNYALGFIAIYVLGFTLATKQPAMTASALIRALETGRKKQGGDEDEKHRVFAEFFARVFRSQFIAFVGNVIMAFPVALLGIWLIDLVFQYNIALTKWYTLIKDLSPVHSLAILHASIAGVFLFLSGIIAGSIANRHKHGNVYYRIAEHPLLKKTFGRTRTQKIAKVYENKYAGIVSNFWFGVFMGTTASIGAFIGLDLDIRHITFTSGNLALALYGANYNISNELLFWGIFGIGVVGLMNFLVSFGLSMGLAFRSRNIPLSELRLVTLAVWQHFKRRPGSFFFPSFRKQRAVQE